MTDIFMASFPNFNGRSQGTRIRISGLLGFAACFGGMRFPIALWAVGLVGLLPTGLQAIEAEKIDGGLHLDFIGATSWKDVPRDEVVSIFMNNMNLTDQDVSNIASMPKLRDLQIGMNPEKVVLQSNDIGELGKLVHLKSLKICVSNPKGLSLSFVGNLRELEDFSLIRDDSAKEVFDLAGPISKMSKLRELELVCKDVQDGHIAQITGACDLTSVSVHSKGITDEAVRSIRSEAGLREIAVSSPQLTDEAGSILGESKSLESLSISSPGITVDFIRRIQGLANLKKLSVSVEEGSREVFEAVGKLEKLESLEVVCVKSGNFDLSAIAGHRNLRRLFVRGVRVSEESKAIVIELPELEYSQIGDWEVSKR